MIASFRLLRRNTMYIGQNYVELQLKWPQVVVNHLRLLPQYNIKRNKKNEDKSKVGTWAQKQSVPFLITTTHWIRTGEILHWTAVKSVLFLVPANLSGNHIVVTDTYLDHPAEPLQLWLHPN